MNVVLRKTGNSTVITIPNKIKEALGAEIGEEIEFVTSGNNVINGIISFGKWRGCKEDFERIMLV